MLRKLTIGWDLSNNTKTGHILLDGQSWPQLVKHQSVLQSRRLTDFFQQDSARFKRFSFEHEELLYDFSKNLIDQETLALLVRLCEEADLSARIDALFSGERVNITENRPALHTALRDFSAAEIKIGDYDVLPQIQAVRQKMLDISEKLRAGLWLGATGKPVTHVVNLWA